MKIELRGVLKTYRARRALDRVSFEIEPGQIVSLLGPNGAGKTTRLRCLAGIAAPDKGEIYYDEQPFRRDRIDLRRRFCFLADFPFLFWEHSVIRNIGIFLRLFEADLPNVEERVIELLADFDLLPLAQMPVRYLSRGQAYKTALTAMLSVDPEVWLLDEPFASGMDPHGINALKRHAREATGRGRTVIYSTQILDVAERFSDRVMRSLNPFWRRRPMKMSIGKPTRTSLARRRATIAPAQQKSKTQFGTEASCGRCRGTSTGGSSNWRDGG